MSLKKSFELAFKQIIQDWINLNKQQVNIIKNENENEEDYEERKNEIIIERLFNSHSYNITKFIKTYKLIKPSNSIMIIQYCNQIYHDNFGDECLLNWKKYDDLDYLIGQLGYCYSSENKDEIIEIYNSEDRILK